MVEGNNKDILKNEKQLFNKFFFQIEYKKYFIESHQNLKEGQQDEIEFLRKTLDNISMETNKSKFKADHKELNLEDK